MKKIFKDLLEVTGRIISRDSILKFQNWYMTKYSHYETRKKYYTTTKNFLKWLYKKTGDYRFRELKELLVTLKDQAKRSTPSTLKRMM